MLWAKHEVVITTPGYALSVYMRSAKHFER